MAERTVKCNHEEFDHDGPCNNCGEYGECLEPDCECQGYEPGKNGKCKGLKNG